MEIGIDSFAIKDVGGISRISFQMDVAGLSHEKLMNAIELIGKHVSPIVNNGDVRRSEN